MKTLGSNYDIFIRAILAGICISFGASVFLSVNNTVLGAVFFSFGLLAILMLKLKLFTGAVGYLGNGVTLKDLCIIWIGNLIGCCAFGECLLSFGSMFPKFEHIINMSTTLVSGKFAPLTSGVWQSYVGLFVAAVLCGVLMFIAVDCFNNEKLPDASRTLIVVFAVSIFIIIGAEHVIADMAYIALSCTNFTTFDKLVFLAFCTVGNAVGSLLFYKGTH